MNVERVAPGPISDAATQYMVRMRDGVHLATDVYLPEGEDAPGPVLLTRMPYDKSGTFSPVHIYVETMLARGYRVVVQDVRGKFRSEGTPLIFVDEEYDGYDTIEWVSQQPWCDGNVAMWGNSYYGYTQFAAMASQHPALKAIAPRLTGTTLGLPYRDLVNDPTRPVDMNLTFQYPLNFFHENDILYWEIDWSHRPITDSINEFLDEHGPASPSFDQWYPRTVNLRRFPDIGNPFDARAIPTLFTIGWWDNCAPPAWLDVEEMLARPNWQQNLHLLIDSIDHYSFELTGEDRIAEAGDDEWRARMPRILGPSLDFFDVYVKGLAPASSIPRVRWNLSHTEGFQESPVWPPADTKPRTIWASETALVDEEPASVAQVGWVHDPENLVPSVSAEPFKYLLYDHDESVNADHPSVVGFLSEPLTEDLDLVGRVSVEGVFSSSGPNMDVHVRLLDVDEHGVGTRIVRGNLHLLPSAYGAPVSITLGHTGYRVRAGHRLQLLVASSDYPEYVAQLGTGEDPYAGKATKPNDQTVQIGGPDGLRIELAVLESE